MSLIWATMWCFGLIHLNTAAGLYNIPESSASGNSVITHTHSHMWCCLPPVPDCFSVSIKLTLNAEVRPSHTLQRNPKRGRERERELSQWYTAPTQITNGIMESGYNIQQLVNEKHINIIYMVKYIKWNCINTNRETEVINNEAYLCIRLCLGSDSIMFINMISLKGLF